MFCRRITSFICIFVTAVIVTAHNDTRSITESDPEVTVYPLTTENPESTTREPDQEVTESIAMDLSALLDAGDGAIVTLVTGDTRLAAHKSVLTARSPVFAATLQCMTLEASSGQLDIPDMEGPVLRHLVAYMYTLQVPQLPSIAPQLLIAADYYGLPALKAHCEQQVAAQLSVETAVAAAVLAVRHSCSSLMQASIAFIKTHIFHVMATQGWADAMNSQPEDLMEVIRLLSAPPAETGAPAPAASGATSTTPMPSNHSAHSSPTLASATPTTAARHTPAPDVATVSPLWSLSPEKKNRALIEAAYVGAVGDVEALLAAGADVDAVKDAEWRRTALHWAAYKGHVEVARRLMAAGAAVEARSKGQVTPLHMAAGHGHVAVVRLLVEEASAAPNATDAHGRTPLHWAAAAGHAAVVRLLVEEASADPNARDVDGRTPLHWAARNGRAEAAAALLQAGADKAATDNEGRTPLDNARNEKQQRLIDILTRS